MKNAFDYSGESAFTRSLRIESQQQKKASENVERMRRQDKEPMRIELGRTVTKLSSEVLVKKGKV